MTRAGCRDQGCLMFSPAPRQLPRFRFGQHLPILTGQPHFQRSLPPFQLPRKYRKQILLAPADHNAVKSFVGKPHAFAPIRHTHHGIVRVMDMKGLPVIYAKIAPRTVIGC